VAPLGGGLRWSWSSFFYIFCLPLYGEIKICIDIPFGSDKLKRWGYPMVKKV